MVNETGVNTQHPCVLREMIGVSQEHQAIGFLFIYHTHSHLVVLIQYASAMVKRLSNKLQNQLSKHSLMASILF